LQITKKVWKKQATLAKAIVLERSDNFPPARPYSHSIVAGGLEEIS